MINNKLALIISAALVAGSASCIYVMVEDPEAAGRLNRPRLEKYFEFPADGALEVEAGKAAIEIRGWDQEEVRIVAEEERPMSSGARIFGPWTSEPDVEIDRTGDRLLIRAGLSEERDAELRLVLSVPRSLRVRSVDVQEGTVLIADFTGDAMVRLESGELRVENSSGSLDARVEEGDITAEFLDVRAEDEIRLEAADGDITIALEDDAQASLDAAAPEGEVTSELELKLTLPAAKVRAELGGGGARIEIRAARGSIRIQRSKGGEDV